MNLPSIASVACEWLAEGLVAAGVVYTLLAAVLTRRFFRPSDHPGAADAGVEGVTVLKPLYGAEPRLRRDLDGLLRQDYPGPVQLVFGLADPADPARAVVQALLDEGAAAEERAGAREAELCIDPRVWGHNRKVSNLINMAGRARHPILVLSDSDIAVAPDYLRRVTHALAAPGAGVVTCPYFGVAATGFWSRVAAMGVSYQFLPNVITGVSLSLARPCMGSTIALRRETLERIGGFAAFADVLADDYAIGAAVRALGLRSVVAPVLVSHSCTETSLKAVFAHELRWARTVKGVDPAGHLGSLVTHPLVWALVAVMLSRGSIPALIGLAAAFLARVWLMRTVDRVIGSPLGPWWLTPMRDIVSFLVFVGSFFGSSVEWRGAKFHVTQGGDLRAV